MYTEQLLYTIGHLLNYSLFLFTIMLLIIQKRGPLDSAHCRFIGPFKPNLAQSAVAQNTSVV